MGDYSGSSWTVTGDSSGDGIDVADPLATAPAAATTATAEGAIPLAGSPGDTYTESVTAEGSNDLGSFTLEPASASNGSASAEWQFSFDGDKTALTTGQTVTQSYNVTVSRCPKPRRERDQTVSVSVGGPGNDNFVFAPGIGADTITNFNPQQDTIELDHFANAQTVQELQALVTTDVHGDAVINLGHNDSITLPA